MIGNDEIANVIALLAIGVSLLIASISQTGWKNKWIIRGLFGLGAAISLFSFTVPVWKNASPTLFGWISALSTNPVFWFALILFIATAFLFTYRTKGALERYVSRLGPERRQEAEPKDVWKQAYIWRDGISGPPQFCFTFAENGRNARLYVDLSTFYAALNDAGWTQTVRLEVKRFDYFARDQTVRINLFEEAIALGAKFWRFAYLHDKDDSDNPEHLLTPTSTCRGRYSLITEDGREFYCYFVIEVGSGTDKPPHVIGQDWFDHAWKWEA